MKTDNAANVGKHAFEIAGLGLAPFKFVGASENFITYPDGTTKAAGTCDYCGTGIRLECRIVSSDKKQSVVGCNCIEKVGDTGILKAYKQSPEFRAHKRKLTQLKDAIVQVEINALLAELSPHFASRPHPYGYVNRSTKVPLTYLDYVKFGMGMSGIAGRKTWVKFLRNAASNLDAKVASETEKNLSDSSK
jgi:hypothetical protein